MPIKPTIESALRREQKLLKEQEDNNEEIKKTPQYYSQLLTQYSRHKRLGDLRTDMTMLQATISMIIKEDLTQSFNEFITRLALLGSYDFDVLYKFFSEHKNDHLWYFDNTKRDEFGHLMTVPARWTPGDNELIYPMFIKNN